MTIQIYSVNFSFIVCRYFSKWLLKISKQLKMVACTPSPSDFDCLPYPRVRWYPHFFIEMTAKEKEITCIPLDHLLQMPHERKTLQCKINTFNDSTDLHVISRTETIVRPYLIAVFQRDPNMTIKFEFRLFMIHCLTIIPVILLARYPSGECYISRHRNVRFHM